MIVHVGKLSEECDILAEIMRPVNMCDGKNQTLISLDLDIKFAGLQFVHLRVTG